MKNRKSFLHECDWKNTIEWYTPKWLFDILGIKFDLDPASPGKLVIPWIPVKKHYTINDNGLLKKWFGEVWLNPPYGPETPKWLKKLTKHGKGMALVFSRTDTRWFQNYASMSDVICFLDKRMRFIPSTMADKYSKGLWDIDEDLYKDPHDNKMKKSQTGCGSILLAFGEVCSAALLNAKNKLGFTIDMSLYNNGVCV